MGHSEAFEDPKQHQREEISICQREVKEKEWRLRGIGWMVEKIHDAQW